MKKNSWFSDIEDWKAFLSLTDPDESEPEEKIITGRPFGPDSFYSTIESITGWNPRPGVLWRPEKSLMSPEFQNFIEKFFYFINKQLE